MSDKIRQLMIAAQRAGVPAWVSDDRESITILRPYPKPDGGTANKEHRVTNIRELTNHLS